jgi:transposase-like protein
MSTLVLTPRQCRAARYLGSGMSQRAASRRLGCDERTLRRWHTDVPGFREHVEELRAAGAPEDATDVLYDLLNDPDSRVRLAAARELRRAPNPNAKPEDDDDADLLDADGWK